MVEEVRIWQVDKADSLTEVKRWKLDREERIEKWISSDISLLSPDLLIIGEQVETAFGGRIDLLCIHRSGNLVVVELKRDKTPREVTAQALDYASWVKDLDAEGIDEIAAQHLKGETLEDAFQSKFGEPPELVNEDHAMLIVASEIDDSTERIIRYLSETYGVDINAVRFQFFQAQDGREFLVRTFTVAPQVVEQNRERRGGKRTTVPTVEQMAEEAAKAGVGELFRQTSDRLSQYLQPRNNKTARTFGTGLLSPRRRVVFSVVPGESSAEKGLRYQLYSKRLSECLGIDENTILSHLPPDRERYDAWQGAPEDLRGWAGYIRNNEDIQRIVDLVKNIERQGPPVS